MSEYTGIFRGIKGEYYHLFGASIGRTKHNPHIQINCKPIIAAETILSMHRVQMIHGVRVIIYTFFKSWISKICNGFSYIYIYILDSLHVLCVCNNALFYLFVFLD